MQVVLWKTALLSTHFLSRLSTYNLSFNILRTSNARHNLRILFLEITLWFLLSGQTKFSLEFSCQMRQSPYLVSISDAVSPYCAYSNDTPQYISDNNNFFNSHLLQGFQKVLKHLRGLGIGLKKSFFVLLLNLTSKLADSFIEKKLTYKLFCDFQLMVIFTKEPSDSFIITLCNSYNSRHNTKYSLEDNLLHFINF